MSKSQDFLSLIILHIAILEGQTIMQRQDEHIFFNKCLTKFQAL